ncbi:hypothetical protein NC652_019903 [Populus alba x Populus x berolinensis]|uniref:Uncharacterized protein n=1 Tax=Populus alba x Populus x berolinensis TaxID=444605 RepID=A0AAD6VWL8_9ROSI|nr:hypothetical protein NC652_019164 [Populus alba x Populus x berolinensis]KAJ6916665.1 hypothetical protein NC652_019168 [Populus alba x Populus x berolinensis]KAJ6917715.1 hypothetical protein NC652_019903 [Populus alba x Populus x berolinensis]KAJ6990600.1 hypothetical protein NC653_018997 [Populus alba x Populus x berolinensis]KAJ6990616.1 hypothetical protein NC653_019010 [Populus alba x Populus x berolinensis]
MQDISATKHTLTLLAQQTISSSQTNIKSVMASKKNKHNASTMTRWWYDINVPFNDAKSYYYQSMINVITSMKLGFKGLSYHDLKGSFLKGSIHDVHEYLLGIKAN